MGSGIRKHNTSMGGGGSKKKECHSLYQDKAACEARSDCVFKWMGHLWHRRERCVTKESGRTSDRNTDNVLPINSLGTGVLEAIMERKWD